MRIPGLIENDKMELLYLQHQEVIDECRQRREGWERWYASRSGCPWGCYGEGWRVVEGEDQEPRPMEIVFDGLLLTPCECNMASTNCSGIAYKWPRRYPFGYEGPRVEKPEWLRRT